MLAFLRQLGLLLVSGALSYVLVLWVPPGRYGTEAPAPLDAPLEVAVRPVIDDPPPVAPPEPEPEPEPVDEAEQTPEAKTELESSETEVAVAAATEAPDEAQPAEQAASSASPEAGDPEALEDEGDPAGAARELMADERYLEQARLEVSGDVRQGFVTDLLLSPHEIVDLARFFGEEVVLVPRDAIDPSNDAPHYFRLELRGPEPIVQRVNSRPPLQAFHRYHDLYDHEFADLPEPIRKLRVQVPSRSRVYLFASLIPVSEMALVVARREQALADSGREEGDVRRFVLDYVHTAPDAYDIDVIDILFSDGSHFRPVQSPATKPTPTKPTPVTNR